MWEEVSYMCVLSMVSQGYLLIGWFCKMTEQLGDCYHIFWVKDQQNYDGMISLKNWWMLYVLLIWLLLPK